MIVRSVRKHSSVKLGWIAKELHMGVRSGVTRAEQMLNVRLLNNRAVQKTWQKMENMHSFYACPPFQQNHRKLKIQNNWRDVYLVRVLTPLFVFLFFIMTNGTSC